MESPVGVPPKGLQHGGQTKKYLKSLQLPIILTKMLTICKHIYLMTRMELTEGKMDQNIARI